MRLFENRRPMESFLEKEVNFPLDKGIKIDCKSQNCEIVPYIKFEKQEGVFRLRRSLPPIFSAQVHSFIFEINPSEPDEFDQIKRIVIDHIDIDENPDEKIILSKRKIIRQPSFSMPVGIKKPRNLMDMPLEADLRMPDGKMVRVGPKSSGNNFIWGKDCLMCNVNPAFKYGVRFRIKINDAHSDWSNWLTFQPETKRTLGRKIS